MSHFGDFFLTCPFSYFPFGYEGSIWDLIVSVPDHCLSFYFTMHKLEKGDNSAKYLQNFVKS